MPKFLANCSDCPSQGGNPRQCYYAFSSPGSYKGLTQPPQHFGDWYRLVRALAAHLVDRHGIAEVAQWHFECVHPSAVRSVFVLSPLSAGRTGCGTRCGCAATPNATSRSTTPPPAPSRTPTHRCASAAPARSRLRTCAISSATRLGSVSRWTSSPRISTTRIRTARRTRRGGEGIGTASAGWCWRRSPGPPMPDCRSCSRRRTPRTSATTRPTRHPS